MTIQDEQKMLETIYKNILSVKQETEKYLAKVEDDTLCQELNLFLYRLKPFEKKAKERIQKPDPAPETICPLSKQTTQENMIRDSINCHRQAARNLKYAIHENKEGGIFATELAKMLSIWRERRRKTDGLSGVIRRERKGLSAELSCKKPLEYDMIGTLVKMNERKTGSDKK